MHYTKNDPCQLGNLHDWLICAHVLSLTYSQLKTLLNEFQCLSHLLQQSPTALNRYHLSSATVAALTQPNESLIEKELIWAEQKDHHLLTLDDPLYPSLLLEIPTPPLVLFVVGQLQSLQLPQLAIVGARKPTPMGMEIAYWFAKELADAGLVITSGLALGIDAAAHRGALAASGATVAVFGCGIDRIYPSAHANLATQICEQGGTLVSEFPIGTPPVALHFPRRNRIVSGLTQGTLVVEATTRSGSLITAHLSVEYGRDVFAIPGSIYNPQARGCHLLLREGAQLVETPADILEKFPVIMEDNSTSKSNLAANTNAQSDHSAIMANKSERKANILPGTSSSGKLMPEDQLDDEQQLLNYVGYEPTSIDMIVARSGQSVTTVCNKLIHLELSGLIVSVNGHYMKSFQNMKSFQKV